MLTLSFLLSVNWFAYISYHNLQLDRTPAII
uniref:Uncharacterized protein n=1 Tax=Arundo donax TaxID=35708 RepID=A0A0A8Y669_ARUDO